jgi:hypothetical protein
VERAAGLQRRTVALELNVLAYVLDDVDGILDLLEHFIP